MLEQAPDVTARMQALLAPDERQRLERMLRAEVRAQYVVMRGALRCLLGAYLGCAPEAVAFSYNELKKPALAEPGPRDLRFNLSHSGKLGLCAFTLGRHIGVDIEYTCKERATEAIAKRFFSRAEAAALAELPGAERTRAFYRCWTSKEAYVKARGDGLAFPLDAFDVAVAPPGARALLRVEGAPEAARQWRLEPVGAGDDYSATCAVAGQDLAWRFWDWQA